MGTICNPDKEGVWLTCAIGRCIYTQQQTCSHGAASTGIRMSAAGGDKKVVVTGLGVVSGVGTGVEEFWKGLLDGKSSINRIERFDPTPFKCQIGAEVTVQYCTVLRSRAWIVVGA